MDFLRNPTVTLADVAARAGMSQATASRALRGQRVHPKHQGKAEAAAAELGYVLNESARSLRSVHTMTVGMVFHDLTSMLGMELLRAMAAGLDDIGYSLFVSTAQGNNERFDKLVHRFLQRRVDALVCVHSNGQGLALDGYAKAGVPVMALITKAGGYSKLPMVGPTIASASEACVARLKELGHRHAAVLTLEHIPTPVADFIAAAKAGKMKVKAIEIDRAAFNAKDTLRALMDQAAPPTVIIALQAEAAKLADAASALKIKVPADLSLVAIRDRSQAPAASSNISTIHLDPAPMGGLAAEVLARWLVDGKALTGDRRIEIGSWIERLTTATARP